MREFESANELMEFCQQAWREDAEPLLLAELAKSTYELGDFGIDECEVMDDEGFLTELFQGHSSIYEALGEPRSHFDPGFPLFRVIAGAHPRTPDSSLGILAEDIDPEVLWAVAGNPSSPNAVLANLAGSRAAVASGIEGRAEPWPDEDPRNPTGIRYGSGMPWELSHVPVAASVAGNRAASPELLEFFAQANHPDLAQAAILRNGDRLTESDWQSLLAGALARTESQAGWIKWIAVSPHAPASLNEALLGNSTSRALLERRLG
jgi:hypothetical protein